MEATNEPAASLGPEDLRDRIVACLKGLSIGESLDAFGIADEIHVDAPEVFMTLRDMTKEKLVNEHIPFGGRDPTYTLTGRGRSYSSVPEPAPAGDDEIASDEQVLSNDDNEEPKKAAPERPRDPRVLVLDVLMATEPGLWKTAKSIRDIVKLPIYTVREVLLQLIDEGVVREDPSEFGAPGYQAISVNPGPSKKEQLSKHVQEKPQMEELVQPAPAADPVQVPSKHDAEDLALSHKEKGYEKVREKPIDDGKGTDEKERTCRFCSKILATRGKKNQHEYVCGKNPDRNGPKVKRAVTPQDLKCRFCGKVLSTPGKRGQHEAKCGKNPNLKVPVTSAEAPAVPPELTKERPSTLPSEPIWIDSSSEPAAPAAPVDVSKPDIPKDVQDFVDKTVGDYLFGSPSDVPKAGEDQEEEQTFPAELAYVSEDRCRLNDVLDAIEVIRDNGKEGSSIDVTVDMDGYEVSVVMTVKPLKEASP